MKTIAVDFTEGHSIYKPLANELANLEIGILINNVGMNVGFCQPFVELASDKSVYDIINWYMLCNNVSYLPSMLTMMRVSMWSAATWSRWCERRR